MPIIVCYIKYLSKHMEVSEMILGIISYFVNNIIEYNLSRSFIIQIEHILTYVYRNTY